MTTYRLTWLPGPSQESCFEGKGATPAPSREAILCQRLKAHSAALTAVLVLDDTGASTRSLASVLDTLHSVRVVREIIAMCNVWQFSVLKYIVRAVLKTSPTIVVCVLHRT